MFEREIEEHDELGGRLRDYLRENGDSNFTGSDDEDEEFDSFDETISDLDFSNVEGKDFKATFAKVNRKISKVIVPKDREVIVEGRSREVRKPKPITAFVSKDKKRITKKGRVQQKNENFAAKVIVPRDRKVIVEGVSKFILSDEKKHNQLRHVGYYKGEKLKEMVLIFNNDSANDFIVDIFNMSMPLNYLYSTSLNLNNKIQVAGGNVQYSDLLYNLLGNPTMIPNCKFTFSGPSVAQQLAIPLEVTNQDIAGKEKIIPVNLSLKIDTFQVSKDLVFFDMQESLNRPFIPNGMDFISYKVLAGMTVTMAFFYKQVDMKKVFYEEARKSKDIL